MANWKTQIREGQGRKPTFIATHRVEDAVGNSLLGDDCGMCM